MDVPIVFRDHHLIVCEKPAGLASESPGLPEVVASQTGLKVFPVHRLDQGTGGLIILALTPESCSLLQKSFQSGLVQKEYMAVVSGVLPDKQGNFTDYLYHDRKKNKTYVVSRPRKGVKEASCDWNVLASAVFAETVLSLIRIRLYTGRTHQIRVQFGSRGFPLVGDKKYGSRIKADTPALWSCRICFTHPYKKQKTVCLSVQPPSGYPWDLFSFKDL